MIPAFLRRLFPKKLYQRLAIVQGFLLLYALGIHHFVILRINRMTEDSAAEHLYSSFAARLAEQITADLRSDVPYAELLESMKGQFALYGNSAYLLDSGGRLLVELTDGETVVRPSIADLSIDVKPLDVMIEHGPNRYFPSYSTDPRKPNEQIAFAASNVILPDGSRGYLYLPVSGQRHVLATMVGEVTNVTIVIGILLSSVFAANVAAYWLFRMTTRRFSATTEAVSLYARGDFSCRAPEGTDDELGSLGGAVNSLADEIVSRETERQMLLSGISHDLHTPIAVLSAYTDTMLDSPEIFQRSDVNQWASIFRRNLDQLQALLQELFEVSMLDADEQKGGDSSFDLNQLLLDLSQSFHTLALRSGVEVRYVSPGADVVVLGSMTKFFRVISNLVGNAIRHTGEGGTVTLSVVPDAERPAEYVTVSIADTGEGIPEDQLATVIDRFAQGTHRPKRAKGLAGLGLAICREILRRHGTDLMLTSMVGMGTTFSFRCRLTPPPRAETPS